jgi:uncharacterized membrane protein YgcG
MNAKYWLTGAVAAVITVLMGSTLQAAPVGPSLGLEKNAAGSSLSVVAWRRKCDWRHGRRSCRRRHVGYGYFGSYPYYGYRPAYGFYFGGGRRGHFSARHRGGGFHGNIGFHGGGGRHGGGGHHGGRGRH